jgi:hypothetical protein
MRPISSIQNLAEMDLHDAELLSVEFHIMERRCLFRLKIFESSDTRDRVGVLLSFDGVDNCFGSLDFNSLISNARWGNVANCRVDIDRKVVRLYLADGLLEVKADSIMLVADR